MDFVYADPAAGEAPPPWHPAPDGAGAMPAAKAGAGFAGEERG
jgi:hypothetical protein